MLLTPFNIFSTTPNRRPVRPDRRTHVVRPDSSAATPDTLVISTDETVVVIDTVAQPALADTSGAPLFYPGTITDSIPDQNRRVFIPDPTRATWLAALCPGLGQIYNRRYWKLPLVIGGFMGLGYGASWNNSMLADYTRAYYDLMDNDPSTKSYMDFFPPTTDESSLSRTWLEQTLKRRKDYFRRNRDLCIIGMVGVYVLAIVDAYVDASLTNFDISPDISMQVAPTIMRDHLTSHPSVGIYWAFNF